MGIFSLREYEDEGSMLVTLNFNGGALSCIIYGPTQSLYSSLGYFPSGEHMGASLISGTRGSNGHTGHQSLLLGSVPSVHLGFHSCCHLSS